MGEYTRINGTVVSHTGIVEENNNDNFYINGRFFYEHETGNIQVSIDNVESDYLFAVMDKMEKELDDKEAFLSMPKELRKFHKTTIQNNRHIQETADQLCELTEEVSNLIFSSNADSEDIGETPSFAGLIIEGNASAIVNYGSTRVYLLREGSLKRLSGDDSNTEIMRKMGIITDEQVDMIEEDDDNSEKTAQKSEVIQLRKHDMFLLCTDGLANAVDEEQIFDILSLRKDTGVIGNMLIREAVRNSGEDNMTAMVVSIDAVADSREGFFFEDNEAEYEDDSRKTSIDKLYETDLRIDIPDPVMPTKQKKLTEKDKKKKKILNVVKRVSILITVVVLVFLLGVTVTKWIKDITGASNDSSDLVDTIGTEESTNPDETQPTDMTTPEPTATPVPTDTPVPTATPSDISGEWPKTYIVKSGDTLIKIAEKFYGDKDKMNIIMEENNITDPNKLFVDQKLKIPAP